MHGTTINNKGKTEKNQKIKEGDCIFPFKYKYETHHKCLKTDKGPICATEVNPKTQTLTKYGYCYLKKGTVKKEPKEKAKTKAKAKAKPKAKEKEKAKTKATTKTKPKPKLKIVQSLAKLKIIPSKTTVKKKRLKIIEPTKISMTPSVKSQRFNEEFIKILSELNDIMMRQGEPFRAKAYRQAAESIMLFPNDITDPKQLQGVKGIGKTIMNKLNEYVETGTLKVLERERTNPLNQLTKVYGIGPKKAKELIEKGITSIADLQKNQDLLTDNMKIGLKYFDDIEARIPRSEIDVYKKQLTTIFNKVTPKGSDFQIVGSYRRGAKTSGDIDIIITNDNNDKKAFDDFLDYLIKNKIILEVLSRGKTKSLTIAELPQKTDQTRPRRVDFLYTNPTEFPFAILYFTGSKAFNTVQRQRALDLGYSLNEHGLYKMQQGQKGEKLKDIKFLDEKSIFNFLKMKYLEPHERIDGNSIINISTPHIAQQPAQQPAQQTAQQPAQQPAQPAQAAQPAPAKIKIKRKTLKKKSSLIPDHIQLFRKEGISALKTLTEDQLSKMIRQANNAYYCNQDAKPLLTDNEYDILREYTARKYPNNEAVKEGHTQCNIKIEKNKVKLPYEMWSMDKIKPDTGALTKWMSKYKGPYVLSCKLDGVSGLYSTEGQEPKLYTRGNGKVGQDVSHLIPFLQLPKTKDIVIRGEFIILKERFAQIYAKDFSNPRNFVAGLINQKKIKTENLNKLKDLDFVAYEVIKPHLKPSAQMEFLTNEDVEVVRFAVEKIVTNELLSELLVAWRDDYKYEIDGVICINDQIYPRQTGNPEHAFAFKMVLSDQIAEAKVLDVIWTPSKDGYLKPRVQIDPVVLGGAKIEYATGFNAKFIVDNKIGVGALIKLIRSGDVIPHIIAVIQPATEPQLPTVPYIWNETKVDILLKDKTEDVTVREKIVTAFFKIIGVEGLGAGNVKRIIEAGFDTVPKILYMSKDDFLTIDGFKQKLATKIHEGIKEKLAEATLPELMHATNIFGRGFGTRRFKAILEKYPDILVSKETKEEKLVKLISVGGMAKKSAEKFIKYLPEFLIWAKEANIQDRLTYSPPQPSPTELSKQQEHPLYGKKWIMTGFRDKELIEKLKQVGAIQASSVSKNTFVVIVKDLNEDTGKADEARLLGIPLMTPDQLIKKYNL